MAIYLFYGMICLFMVKYTIWIFFKYKEKLIQEILVTIIYNSLSQDLKNIHGEGNGNSLLYSCLGNPMDRGAWQATVHGVAKSRTRLSN